MTDGDGVFQAKGALTRAECATWLRAVYEARNDWTPCFDGVQFTLGRAYYTHLEEGRADEYFAAARASDAIVERALPGLQARMRELLANLVGAPVAQRPGWCGPGLHIFPSGQWLSENGGDVHFDTEGLLEEQLAARRPARSVIVMLQAPARGGGLRVWSNVYDGDDQIAEPDRDPDIVIDYDAGDLVAIDSYRLHQIQPFEGSRDRVSITAHLVHTDDGWHAWF
jgi:hypothetical protein